MSTYRKKVFPLRLPQNFHGQPRVVRKLSQAYQQNTRLNEIPNPQLKNNKIVNWQIKRLNKDIISQRRQYLVHTGKISQDTPYWFQTTTNYYRRDEAPSKVSLKNPQDKQYDVFCRRRMSLADRMTQSQFTPTSSKLNSIIEKNCSWNVTQKIGSEQYNRNSSIHFYKSDVTPKIGSVEQRDFSVRKPQMKVGKTIFIDTYSPK